MREPSELMDNAMVFVSQIIPDGCRASQRTPRLPDLGLRSTCTLVVDRGSRGRNTVASRISEICINCADPDTMARFWSAALGYPEIDRNETGVAIMGAPNRPSMLFVRTDDVGGPPKTGRNRLHIDLSPTDCDQDAEVSRLELLGAKRIDIGQGTPTWVVLADPEGNEFCVLRRRVPPEPAPYNSDNLG